jgi:hypothetical protein
MWLGSEAAQRRIGCWAVAIALGSFGGSSEAVAQAPAAAPRPSSSAKVAPRPAGAAPSASALPPGHPDPNGDVVPAGPLPAMDPDGDEDDDTPLPPGHPTMPSGHPDMAQGGAANAANPGVFDPPPDAEQEDPNLPTGTIVVELQDWNNVPIPHSDVTIGILHQSVAKGESREHKAAITDEKGLARVDGLETGSGVAYRITVVRDAATFAAMPFQLPASRGEHVTLHVYDVTRSIKDSLIVMQGILFAEVKDDRIQIEQIVTVFNLGKVAWVPDDVVMRLPTDFTALSSQQMMNDQGVDSVDKVGGRLHGTFAPGRHEVQFRWQVPYSGQREVEFDVGLPPHVAVMRVMAGGAQGVKLIVTGFPEAQSKTDNQGARVLVTEKQVRRGEPFDSMHVRLEGLPTPGYGRIIATCLAGSGVLLGIGFACGLGAKPEKKGREKSARARLLAELLELEEARQAGDVGPKTYERARRELVDAIARTLEAAEG